MPLPPSRHIVPPFLKDLGHVSGQVRLIEPSYLLRSGRPPSRSWNHDQQLGNSAVLTHESVQANFLSELVIICPIGRS